MNKLLSVATLLCTATLLHANTISAPSALIGNNALEGNDAYAWGISIAVPTGQQVASAEIDFSGVVLTASGNPQGTGIIYTDLLKSKTTGLSTVTDNDNVGDYWATKFFGGNITSLPSKFFKSVGTTATWSDVLSVSQLATLNSYLAADNGVFDIGIDPDCHFTVGGLSFTYTLTPVSHSVPDAAGTACLLFVGLAGLEVFRRQFFTAKAKA